MSTDHPSLAIDSTLVGAKVRVPARPEWGVGVVLRIQGVDISGQRAHRVTVQFPMGTRTLVAPPAILAAPADEPDRRQTGWLDSLAGKSLDDRLRALPADVTDTLGGPRERIYAAARLYEITGEPAKLHNWARRQTGVADPLGQWNRDELEVAFRDFCLARDAFCRNLLFQVRKTQGVDAARAIVDESPTETRAALREAMRGII